MKSIYCFQPQRINHGFGMLGAEAKGFVAVDMEIIATVGGGYFFINRRQECIGFIQSRVDDVSVFKQMPVCGLTQGFFHMSERLVVANQGNLIIPGKPAQFVDLCFGNAIVGCYTGMPIQFKHMLGIKSKVIEFKRCHGFYLLFQHVHGWNWAAADVVLPGPDFNVRFVVYGHAWHQFHGIIVLKQLPQCLQSIKDTRIC
ncbi:hypothetical protein DSECCO2_625730 [anaerobic digester metagenome]